MRTLDRDTLHDRPRDWHPDFYRDKPSTDQWGNRRYPSADFKPSIGEAAGGFNKQMLILRGWTRTAIKRILGEPDRRIEFATSILSRSRRKGRPECIYDRDRVLAAEASGPIRFRLSVPEALKRTEDRRLYREHPFDEMDELADGEGFCECCGKYFKFQPKITGRKRKYCTARCRNRRANLEKRLKKLILANAKPAL